jgi:multidrug efflux pump subunit AcrB
VHVSDIGNVIEAAENNQIGAFVNKQPAILLAIQRQPGANVIETVDRIKSLLPQLQASLPPGIKLDILSDRTQTIRASVSDVQFTLLLTVALVVMVIFILLRNFWATVIPAITVPLSLIGTFAALYALGYSLDNLSLMALSIAIGFVVDDAVVVIENIVRHLEAGLSPMEAALKGSSEIGFTIISITLSLIAVFIPLFLMGGYVGKLFQEFAITVSVSLILSLLISLTLTPMMCSRLLEHDTGRHGWLYLQSERAFDGLLAIYERGLRVALRHRFITLMTMFLTGDRLSLRRHSKGLLSATGHRPNRRHRRSRSGYLLSCDDSAHASRDRQGRRGSRRIVGGVRDRRRRRSCHCQPGTGFYHAEAAQSAQRQCGRGHQPTANQARSG